MTRVRLRADRVVLRMFGRDPLKMIQGLATNDIAGAAVDESVYTAFLTPKGRMVGDARVLRRPNGDIWLEADRAAAQSLEANFKKFVPPLFAKFEHTSMAVLELAGDHAAEMAEGVTHDAVLKNPFRADVIDLIVPGDRAAAAEQEAVSAGAAPMDANTLEVLRIEAGEPKWGAELTEDVIPLEAGLRHLAISETKGCYTGQEVIIRILHRGHVNRHLRGIVLQSSEVPHVGADIVAGEKVAGRLTSACYSGALGQAIGLGYVRRELVPPAVVTIEGFPAQIVELPFVTASQGA